MKAGIVQHDHTARRQDWQEHLFKIDIHDRGVAAALEHQRGHQFVGLGSGNNAGPFAPFASHLLINPFAPRGATVLTIQAVIHAALVQIVDGGAGVVGQLAAEEPPLDLVALAIFCEFFLK